MTASDFPQIPGFELQAELGRGGMATVYRAIETNLDRQVAIKIVHAVPGDPDGHIERLENEARGLAALQHPHIVNLYKFGRTADGSLFYVMPLLPGGSLEDWSRPAPEARVVALLENLLDALEHAHAADIIHRDIKPANILFDRHERPLLADFGAALMRRRDTRLTMHGAAIGSSGYMSPEQARGLDVDARSDLYSTAVLGFELLTGRRPFEGPDDLAIAIAQTEQPVPTLPDDLKHWQPFFDRALAVIPDRRFADAAAMRAAMRGLQHAPPAPPAHGVRLVIALVAGIVVVATIAIAMGWRPTPAEPVHPEAVEALFAAGRLTPPDAPNVLAELERARGQELDRARLDDLRTRLLAALARDADAALAAGDGARAATAWTRWNDAVERLDATLDPDVTAGRAAMEATLRTQLDAALAAADRNAAAPALALVDAWGGGAPMPLADLAARVRAIPVVGERFTDAGGPELVFAAAPEGTQPGLAVMAAAVDTALYQRYAGARGLTPVECAGAASDAQGCIDLAEANDFAAWLSEQTNQRYRVPSREELAAAIAHVEVAPAYALTTTCNQVRVARPRNVGTRIRSGVRELFGRRPEAQATDSRCAGHFALKLDGHGGDARVQGPPTPETTVVLVRDMGGATP
jgi:serine/threonine-protein kinase PpkA